ncbi:hypothetical protein LTR56_002126 [Elasticomyces elasticus]|nr:hypothetical protein LTR56_002126 [Elasticomyces elasticus]KAK3666005.1 hypothetical protein LTR22_003008 [Elasticomyces elasticus]KAK4929492.1 hypothetical protein LTR49_003787 [Elasticomyces elasticus]
MSEGELILCKGPECKQPNPRREIDHILRGTVYLREYGDRFHTEQLAAIGQIIARPTTSISTSERAKTETDLLEELRPLQKRMTKVCERLAKVGMNVHIESQPHLLAEIPSLREGLQEVGKKLNMRASHIAEREQLAEKSWRCDRRWRWAENVDSQQMEDSRLSEEQRWPRIGQVVAEGLVASMEMGDLDFY